LTYAKSASCVQRLDDSQIHANRTTFRTLLRSSSLQEPRDPLLKVVKVIQYQNSHTNTRICSLGISRSRANVKTTNVVHKLVNDPSAGSPTETLLRLLLPLNDQV
jgi:hypothetical protein